MGDANPSIYHNEFCCIRFELEARDLNLKINSEHAHVHYAIGYKEAYMVPQYYFIK